MPARPRAIQMLRQCSDDVLRMLVTGEPPVRGAGGISPRIHDQFALAFANGTAIKGPSQRL